MSVGFIVLVAWLFSAASGASSYAPMESFLASLPGRALLIGWSFAFFFHLLNGIRHLFWDVGKGFEIRQANRSAWIVLLTAIGLTALFWWRGL